MKILIQNGKFLLAGGRLLTMAGPAAPVAQSPDTLTLIDFYTAKSGVQPIVQRKAGQTYADVPVLFTFTGPVPSNVQARVIKASGGAVVTDWTTLTNVTTKGSYMLGTLPAVPQGAGYLVQIMDGLQPTNIATMSNGAVPWGVGVVFLFQGQSNMVNTLAGDYNETVPGSAQNEFNYYNAGNIKGAILDNAGWHAPSNGSNGPTGTFNGSGNTATGNIMKFMRIVSARLKAQYGVDVPVGIIPWAFGNQTIEKFLTAANGGDATYYNLFTNSGVDAAGTSAKNIGLSSPRNVYAGDFEGIFWHQGEANQADSPSAYLAKLTKLRQQCLDYVAPFGRNASAMFFGAAVVGNYAASACPSIENIRKAVLDSGWAAWTTIDLPRTDTLHFGGVTDQKRSMNRCIQSALKWLGCATFSGRGPRITVTSVARSGNTAVIPVEHDGGTALTTANGSATPTGFVAHTRRDFGASGAGVDVNVVATISGAGQFTLTFDEGQTFPVYVKYLGGRIGHTAVDANGYTASCNPDIRNPAYDNVSYPTGATGSDVEARGLPVLPTRVEIEVTN